MSENPPSREIASEFSLQSAIGLATSLHEGQVTKDGRDYIEHPSRAAEVLKLQGYGGDVQMVAVLHDVIEKTDMTLGGLRELGVPEAVVQGVDSVSIREGEDYFDAMNRAKDSPLGILVRLADNRDHVIRIINSHLPKDEHDEQIAKYEEALRIIIRDDFELSSLVAPIQIGIYKLYANSSPK